MFGILQGFLGKKRMSPAISLFVSVILLIVLSWGFFWALSTIGDNSSTCCSNCSSNWMKDGAVIVVAGIIGAYAYDVIKKSFRGEKKEEMKNVTYRVFGRYNYNHRRSVRNHQSTQPTELPDDRDK